MKVLNKLFLIILVFGMVSCDSFELDLRDDPNNVSPDQAGANELFNRIQLDFNDFVEGTWFHAGALSRMRNYSGGFTYNDAYTAPDFNGLWLEAYSNIFPDVDALLNIAAETGLCQHSGAAKVLKAYVMVTLVDLFGDVPYSQIGQGTDVISPGRDAGADVYAAANALLDDAIAELDGCSAAAPANDLFYGGDAGKWAAAARTIQLKMALQTRLVSSSESAATISKLINEDIIDEASEDFQFTYSANRENPDSRHPFYVTHYESSDGIYMSNYYMWLLRAEKLDSNDDPVVDPRIRFYFYRQISDACEQDGNTYSCVFTEEPPCPIDDVRPQHYKDVDPRLPYCIVWEGDGYIGRDHMNGTGIPPDGPIRTVFGLYPGGGKYDDNTFDNVQNSGTDGAKGEGINPLLLSSFVDFMRAEAALTLGTGEDPRALLESGIQASMDKVFSFASKVAGDLSREIESPPGSGNFVTVEELFVDQAADRIPDYIAFVLDQYDNAANDTERLNIIIKEYLIALWGNGMEAYNNYRRTCMPLQIQPALEPAAGPFASRALYPSNHVDFNQNANQVDETDKVFWDTANGCY